MSCFLKPFLKIYLLSDFNQTQHGRAVLVRLGEHGLRSLQQDVILRVLGHFLGHVGIADGGLGMLNVLAGSREIRCSVLKPALDGADGGLLVECLVDGFVEYSERILCFGAGSDADFLAGLTLQSQRLGMDI